MRPYLSETLIALVRARADERCEYCGILIDDTYFGGEVDHIQSLKHQGKTEESNLALACQPCNRFKGTDLGSVADISSELIRFFNPRTDQWAEHFSLATNGMIIPLTPTGEVTVRIFRFNDDERVVERFGLMELRAVNKNDEPDEPHE